MLPGEGDGIPSTAVADDHHLGVTSQRGDRQASVGDQGRERSVCGCVNHLGAQFDDARRATVGEHAATGPGPGLEHHGIHTLPGQLAGTGQASSPGPDDHDVRVLHPNDSSGCLP